MNYIEMKEEQSKIFNAYYNKYSFFAFDDSDFKEGMEKLGLEENETEKIVSIGNGGYVLKSSLEIYKKLRDEAEKQRKELYQNDKFLYQAIMYELYNHEYFVFEDEEPTLNALGFTIDELEANDRLRAIFEKATKDYMKKYY